MTPADIETILRDLPRLGTLIKERPYRQIWRFQAADKAYFLKFYPRPGSRLKKMLRGDPAMREFTRLQSLQKAKIPAPRAIAVLAGYTLNGVKGDAVISQAIEPSITLDRYFNNLELRGERAPDHHAIATQLIALIHSLGEARLGHDDLHLGNVLKSGDKLYLLDAYALTNDGLKLRQMMRLAHSVARYATRQDIRRAWNLLAPDSPMPRRNSISPLIWSKFMSRIGGDNRYFGKLRLEEWSGVFFKQWKYPSRFSATSRLEIDEKDWQREWPPLIQKIDGGLLEVLKTSRSGDVLAGEVTLAGRPIEVIIKRPRRKHWYRYINELGRGSRAWRAWKKSWALLTRNIPAAWPLAIMEKRTLGYVTDQVIVFERVPGKTLATTNLDLINADQRDRLFRRCGRILRRIETVGFSHFDSKASNWIIMPDDKRGPTPVLVDVDGVRFYPWTTFGIRRLLDSMREHRQYTIADSLALCQGYAPFTRVAQEEPIETEEPQ